MGGQDAHPTIFLEEAEYKKSNIFPNSNPIFFSLPIIFFPFFLRALALTRGFA